MSNSTQLKQFFDGSLKLKGLDGGLEIIGGLLLAVVKPATVNRLIVVLTQHELSQDPRDFFANHILKATSHLASTKFFDVLYLLSHGLVKVILVVALLRGRRWAYPWMLAFLGGYIVYQIYRIGLDHSIGLTLLTVFDALVFWLTWHEWRRLTPASA